MSLQWERLVSQGRAKNIGIAWTEDEARALYDIVKKANITREIAAGYIREGVKSYEDFLEAKTPKTRDIIEKEAKDAGIKFAPEAPTTVLEKEIKEMALKSPKINKVKKTK